MKSSIKNLAEIDFQHIGNWELTNTGALICRWKDDAPESFFIIKDVLYAFSIDGIVKYLGKTTQGVKKNSWAIEIRVIRE